MKLLIACIFVLTAGCSGAATSTDGVIGDRSSTIDSVQVNGALRLETRDMPLSDATPPFGPPTISTTAGAIDVSQTQLGSLCEYALTANADVRGNKVGLHLLFSERLTVCTADVRALQYAATLTIAPGTYDVAVVHELNGATDTLSRASVTVP